MRWLRRVFNLLLGNRFSSEIDREVSFHLAERTDELMGQGMSKRDAMREARRRFGNPSLQRGRRFRTDMTVWLESVLADLRYATRSTRRSPGFATVAIVSLGLGIGATTASPAMVTATRRSDWTSP